jgi:preprotein translocase subunit YajC
MFITAIILMLIVSFLMALYSLRKELKKPKEVHSVHKELMHGKVLYVKD